MTKAFGISKARQIVKLRLVRVKMRMTLAIWILEGAQNWVSMKNSHLLRMTNAFGTYDGQKIKSFFWKQQFMRVKEASQRSSSHFVATSNLMGTCLTEFRHQMRIGDLPV